MDGLCFLFTWARCLISLVLPPAVRGDAVPSVSLAVRNDAMYFLMCPLSFFLRASFPVLSVRNCLCFVFTGSLSGLARWLRLRSAPMEFISPQSFVRFAKPVTENMSFSPQSLSRKKEKKKKENGGGRRENEAMTRSLPGGMITKIRLVRLFIFSHGRWGSTGNSVTPNT